jgi:hypothetical protein
MGATSAVVAAALFMALFLIIRKQLATSKTTAIKEACRLTNGKTNN